MINEKHQRRDEEPNLQNKEKKAYSNAVREWYQEWNSQFPENKVFIVGSAATNPNQMRLGLYTEKDNYDNARLNHIYSAMSEESSYKPSSDIDVIIVDKDKKEVAVEMAKKVFANHGVLLHIHAEPLKEDREYKKLTQDLIDLGIPF